MQPQSCAQNSTPLQGIQVLLVEDEQDLAELLEFLLRDAGAKVVKVDSARKAFEQLDRYLPDVLVCNLRLPDLDGKQLLQRLRAATTQPYSQIPAIAITSYTADYSQRDSLKAGFDHFIQKPVEPEQLISAIAELSR